jgi:hypothetical protein
MNHSIQKCVNHRHYAKQEWLDDPSHTPFLSRRRNGEISKAELHAFVSQHPIYSRCFTRYKAAPLASAERKHPVYFVDQPSHAFSVTIGGLLPGDRSNRHRPTCETRLYVLEGRGDIVSLRPRSRSAGGLHSGLGMASPPQLRSLETGQIHRLRKCAHAAKHGNVGVARGSRVKFLP